MRSGVIKLIALIFVFAACDKSQSPSVLPAGTQSVGTTTQVDPNTVYQQPVPTATTLQVPCCPNGGQLQYNGAQASCVGAVNVPTGGIGITYSPNGNGRRGGNYGHRDNNNHRGPRTGSTTSSTSNRRNNGNNHNGNYSRNRNGNGSWGVSVGFGTQTRVQAIPASTCVASVNQQMPCDINYTNGDICSSAIAGQVNPTFGGVRCYPVNGTTQGYCGQAQSALPNGVQSY